MAPQPRIGTRIRRAMERKRMKQSELASSLGVSRSAVNAWINDRAWPQGSIGALEEVLEITLVDDRQPAAGGGGAPLSETERRELMEEYERLGRRLFGPPAPGQAEEARGGSAQDEGRTA
jgi:transcriptional regulator with XRE-family HTH domain